MYVIQRVRGRSNNTIGPWRQYAVDVELDQKDALMLTNGDSNLEPSGQELGASPPAGEAAHGMSDQRIGKAETLTIGGVPGGGLANRRWG